MDSKNINTCEYSTNSVQSVCRDNYFKIIDNGTYYYPAWKHYRRDAIVNCDRCDAHNISSCVGFGEKDLCLMCVHELTKKQASSYRYGGVPVYAL
jgi:hypothetical protein